MPVTIQIQPVARPAGPTVMARGMPAGPLAGLTLLAVEDSRVAADALRLLCRSQGGRLRRAASLAEAERHLSLYRPDAILVDLGLPDGRGEALVAALARSPKRPPAILALSGDPARGAAALACGADAFLAKPVLSAECLAEAVLHHLPYPARIVADTGALPPVDPLSVGDDLALACELLADDPDASTRAYLSAFLCGVARQAGDSVLLAAAEDLANGADRGLILRLMDDRRAAIPVL